MNTKKSNALELLVEVACVASIVISLAGAHGLVQWLIAAGICFVGSWLGSNQIARMFVGRDSQREIDDQPLATALFRAGVLLPLVLGAGAVLAVVYADAQVKDVGWIMVALAGAAGRSIAFIQRASA